MKRILNIIVKMKFSLMKYILMLIVLALALGYAGKSDYKDSVVTEMKNNGAYYELVRQYPSASEDSLITIYLTRND